MATAEYLVRELCGFEIEHCVNGRGLFIARRLLLFAMGGEFYYVGVNFLTSRK